MPKPVPTPVAAALGLIPATLDGVRGLPGKVVQLPILAVSNVLTTLDAGRRGYDDLAERGERLVARLRGVTLDDAFDRAEDAVEDALQGTPVAGLYDRVEDAAEDAVEGAGRALRSVTTSATKAADAAAGKAGQVAGSAEKAVGKAAQNAGEALQESVPEDIADVVPADEAPKGKATPKATEPDSTRVDSAAPAEAQRAADSITAATGAVLEHDDLPLADYDHMTLGSLRGRLRSLSLEQLGQVRAYEKAHADRLPVVTMLDNRIAKLTSDITAQPTGKTDAVDPAGTPAPAAGGSKVQPATGGPALNPPSQGDPTNPAQPR